MRPSLFLAFILVTSACSKKTDDAAKRAPAPAPAPAKPALAPKEQMMDTYEEIFQRGPMLPMPERIKAFVDKVGAPKRTEGDKRFWFVRDADNKCNEVTLDDSGTEQAQLITDEAKATAECGPTK